MWPRIACVVCLSLAGCGPAGSGDDTDDTGAPPSPSSSSTGDSPTTGASTGDASCMALAPDFTAPPSSTRDGDVVTTVGPGPRFQIPASWSSWNMKFGNNLHLTRPELEAVRAGAGEWDTEYAAVLAPILDFDRCAAHVGGEGWGQDAVSFSDLQVRVYVLEQPLAEVLAAVQSLPPDTLVKQVTLTEGTPWTRVTLGWENVYGDYGGPARVDLRLRRFERATVVFAGMYSDWPDLEPEFDAVVASACWTPGAGACCPSDA